MQQANKEGDYMSEPKAPLITTRIDIIKALNYYSAEKDEKLREYAVKYFINKNNTTMADKVAMLPAYRFQSYGAICRMLDKGFDIEQKYVDDMLAYFTTLTAPAQAKVVKRGRKPKAVIVDATPDIVAFDEALDATLLSRKITFPEVSPNDSKQYIKKECERGLKELETKSEGYCVEDIPLLTAFYNKVLDIIKQVKKVERKTKVVKTRKPPTAVVKKVQYMKEFDELQLKSLSPLRVLDSTKLYVYDTEKRKLFVFTSKTGFTFKGTTLLNVDFENSFRKTVRKPKEFFVDNANLVSSISGLNKAFSGINGKATPLTSARFNENMIILKVN